ncbi:MAG: glycosyltransferase family 2 protein [Eubacteriales bacterium]|nr:glycosyltransferase family 2 protein [Eubacteriales bacterium]
MNKILVMIPAYNEAENIEKVVDNLIENYPQYDYVVLNDGSTDDTRKICARRGYNFLDLPINVGLSGAIKSGMRYANCYGYDYVLQLDGDGQHDPAYIEKLWKCMEETNADIIIGSRFKTERKPFTMRMIGSQLLTAAICLTTRGKYIGDVTSGMRLFNKKMIKRFGYDIHYSPEPDTLAYLLNCGVKIEEVQVTMHERTAGVSYLNLRSSAWYMMKMLFSILIFQWVRVRVKEESDVHNS